ncbi:Chromosome-associated kinesin KIF4 [Frankliniella fusca]|uniref:Chromosome-associated kinesin KIF4 n=1 Tax=Frankliniella fusca TaxID=407009 RepID=A0AAE1L9Q9_9NEOP|nr:Chromosome-associated kinesin KIF4 [Frankliniella fusca]
MYSEVHVVFDRYRSLSVKSGTREKRAQGFLPVRRVIKNGEVPLPKNWSSFLSLSENKADLTRFLSEQAMKHNFGGLEVIMAGGFIEETRVESSNSDRDLTSFQSNHEEADTRMVLHATQLESETVVVSVRDSDVILLFIHHYQQMKCKKCWIMCGTQRDRKYIPIHTLCEQLKPDQIKNLLAFHAITGCDTTSKLASVTKTTGWKNYEEERWKLLKDLGESSDVTSAVLDDTEQFVVQALYKVGPEITKADAARVALFGTVKMLEYLPPTSDALRLHLKRCHFQVYVWKNAHIASPILPDPKDCGWNVVDERYVPVLKTLPSVPKSCPVFSVCGCKGLCSTKQCGCRKDPCVPCTKMCKCKAKCLNGAGEEGDKDEFL